jgi:DNA primase
MKAKLNRQQIIDLLENVLHTYVRPASKQKSDIQFNCTVHGEENPSAGFSVDKNVFNCFACHANGGAEWLLYRSLDKFKSVQQAREFLQERYDLDMSVSKSAQKIKRYSDFIYPEHKERKILPRTKLAPFRSGKETYEYIYDRGFTSETIEKFMIGRDLRNKTVTIPVFYGDGGLAGFVGRYIDPNRPKNSRYRVYKFSRSKLLYPLHKFFPVNDTVILVEGILDALWLHQLGFSNALSIMNNKLSYAQVKFIKSRAKRAVLMFDDNEGGGRAVDRAKDLLSPSVLCFEVEYPEDKEDPQECYLDEIQYMIDNKISSLLNTREIVRL